MKLPITIIPPEIIEHYHLASNVYNNNVFIKISKGLYGLKQSRILDHKGLIKHLQQFNFHPTLHTPGLWIHSSRHIMFTLVQDDFVIKYTDIADAHYLFNYLQEKYNITIDWKGSLYCGITLDWDYVHHIVDISIPAYIHNLFNSLKYISTKTQYHSP